MDNGLHTCFVQHLTVYKVDLLLEKEGRFLSDRIQSNRCGTGGTRCLDWYEEKEIVSSDAPCVIGLHSNPRFGCYSLGGLSI